MMRGIEKTLLLMGMAMAGGTVLPLNTIGRCYTPHLGYENKKCKSCKWYNYTCLESKPLDRACSEYEKRKK